MQEAKIRPTICSQNLFIFPARLSSLSALSDRLPGYTADDGGNTRQKQATDYCQVLSRKIVTKHWWHMFGFMIVVGLLGIAGLLACIVGFFVTSTIGQIATMYAYEDILRSRHEPAVVIP